MGGPYPIEGDELGDVEYALIRADWQQHDQQARAGTGRLSTKEALDL
jgi:hypothetical protein